MGSIFVIKPENNNFLTKLSTNELLNSVSIKQIEVDPKNRSWKVMLTGKVQGPDHFWQDLAEKFASKIVEIDHVEFLWETDKKQDDINYLNTLLQNGKHKPVTVVPNSTLQPKKTKRKHKLEVEIKDKPTPIASITDEQNSVTIQGEIVDLKTRTTRSGKILVTFDVYDKTDTITCKIFLDQENELPNIKVEDWVKVKGSVQFQNYDRELSIMANQINRAKLPQPVEDRASKKRVELHLHTKMSGLDGIIDIEEAIKQAALWKHPAVAITDHGGVQAFPAAYFAGKKYGIKVIYGMEGYLIDQDHDRPYHIIILAKNKIGLKNLYKLVSVSHLEYFYRRPRIPREILNQHREGLILGSACEQGEFYQAVLNNANNIEDIARFYDYLEIQPLGNNEFLINTDKVTSKADLENINKTICDLGSKLNIPVVATCDVHFLRPEDSLYRTILLSGQGFENAERQAPLYFRTTEEMLAEFKYLGESLAADVVIHTPNKIASEIDNLEPIPQGLHPPKIPDAENKLKQLCYDSAYQYYGNPLPDLVNQRLDRELSAIIANGYAALYWIAHRLVQKSMDDGYLVGSRGSVGSSFAAYVSGITEVNPLPPHYICPQCHYNEFFTEEEVGTGVDLSPKKCPKCSADLDKDGYGIPFEVFLGFHGDKVPDIDLNFSGEYQGTIQKYTEELFGSEYVFRAGTIGTLADKSAYGFVKNYLEDTNDTRRNAEINRMLRKLVGVKRTTGQHPGGMIVVPKDMEIYDFTPIQYPANDPKSGVVTTHFEFSYIHDSLVKLDNLGHKGPTMMRMFEELSNVRVTKIPLDDPDTMKIFCGLESLAVSEDEIGTCIGTLGIPEFGTGFTRQMLEDIRPSSFADLVAIMGLSHGTDVWLNNAQTLIKKKITDFKNVIACRDDIMVYLIHRGMSAPDAFRIMEQVRKGRGLTEEDVVLMKQYDVPDWYIDSCFKIKYMFPKAHAVAYAITAYRAAYFKVHHPEVFYATYLSLEIDYVNADIIIQGKEYIKKHIESINNKGNDATVKEQNDLIILEIVLEAMARNIEFLPVDLYKSDQKRVIPLGNKLLLPLVSLDGVGFNAAENIVSARSDGEFISIEDLRQRTKISKTVIEALAAHKCLEGMSETNQLSLFNEI